MMSTGPRPCSSLEAVARVNAMVGQGEYIYGTGDYRPRGGVDVPWTSKGGKLGSDCAGLAICYAYMLRRNRPGFARGSHPVIPYDIDDDINCNSALEDALGHRELFEPITTPALGCLLVYPTFRIAGRESPFIGHVGIVVSLARCLEWNPLDPDYSLLDVVQCRGPNGRSPGVVRTDGSLWDHHDERWPKIEHRTTMLRATA